MIQVRGFSVKSLASVLFFISALRQPDMSLSGELAFFEGVHDFSIANLISPTTQ